MCFMCLCVYVFMCLCVFSLVFIEFYKIYMCFKEDSDKVNTRFNGLA